MYLPYGDDGFELQEEPDELTPEEDLEEQMWAFNIAYAMEHINDRLDTD